ncbi:hypothetical protein ACFL3G_13585, partial [Planctomycetota bacterium]
MGSEKEKIELLIEQNVQQQLDGVDFERLGRAISERIEKEPVCESVSVRFPRVYKMAVGIAAMLVVGAGLWYLVGDFTPTTAEQGKIVSLEEQVRQLSARADATLRLVEQMVAEQQRQRRLNELKIETVSVSDPLEKMQEQVDRTAFILIYQADRMYKELGLK